MTTTQHDVSTLTDAALEAMDTATLREWATAVLSDYARRTTVASITMHLPALLAVPGAVGVIEKALHTLLKVHESRGPVLIERYGSVEVQVWQEDASLRDSLRFARKRAQDAAQDEPEA